MKHPANTILTRRAQSSRKSWAVVFSLAMHGALVLGAFLVPILVAHARPPIEFRTVNIVPVQALGVPDPEPQPEPALESRPEPPKPKPKPEPEKPRPAPTPSPTAPAKADTPRQPPAAEPAPPRQRQGSPLGSDIASSPFGAAGVGLDNPDFTYGYYVDQMLSMISGSWVRPRVGRIEAIVYFRIARDGTVSQLKLMTSSGNRAFDEAALRAVTAAAPLPPLPASFSADSLGVRLAVR